MANGNFIVQNGLTVGPLTIDAATGSINTSGDVNITGNLGVSQIAKNDSSVKINDTGTGSTIVFTIDGTQEATISSTGLNVIGGILDATTVRAATIGNASAILYGTLNSSSASQPNVTTLAGLTGFGAAGATTTAAGNFTVTGNLTVNGTTNTINNTVIETTEYVTTQYANTVNAVTIGNIGANHVGTGTYLTSLNASNLGSGTVPSAQISGSYTGITGLGTVTVGVWNAGAVTSSGVVQGTSFTSTVATGTAPFTVTSTTTVTNLSADLWDGNHFSSYLNQAVLTSSSPTFAGITLPSITKNGTSGTGDIGSSGNYFGTVYGKATTAQYADLAENYQADKQYNPGTVVMFGGEQEVTLASIDTTAVAGVVSTNPAHLMNGALTGPNVVAVAFTGRVPCNVIGPVKKGDLMVSAGFGYAKVNNEPKVGTIIGKALQDFPMASKGVIEVVVGRF